MCALCTCTHVYVYVYVYIFIYRLKNSTHARTITFGRLIISSKHVKIKQQHRDIPPESSLSCAFLVPECMYVRMYVYEYVCVCIYAKKYNVCKDVELCVCIGICTNVYAHKLLVCAYMFTCVHAYPYMYIYICVCMYIYICRYGCTHECLYSASLHICACRICIFVYRQIDISVVRTYIQTS